MVLSDLAEKASLVYTKMNEIPGVKCSEVQGAMYAYPCVDIPSEALEDCKVGTSVLCTAKPALMATCIQPRAYRAAEGGERACNFKC